MMPNWHDDEDEYDDEDDVEFGVDNSQKHANAPAAQAQSFSPATQPMEQQPRESETAQASSIP